MYLKKSTPLIIHLYIISKYLNKCMIQQRIPFTFKEYNIGNIISVHCAGNKSYTDWCYFMS